MANLIIQAVQISLGQEFNEDATLGLYTVSGTSYLRWSEAALVGVAETWASDILLKNGISEITESSDLSRGGNIVQYSGATVRATNAESLKTYLDDLGVNLIGLPATITEFEGTAADSDSVARTTRFTGVVEDIKWGDTTFTINLKNSLYKRETNIGTVTSEGVTIPVTFGKHTPVLSKIVDGVETTTAEINNIAKFVRTDDTYDEETYKEFFFTGVQSDIKIFPVTSISVDKVTYYAQAPSDVTFSATNPDDCYVVVVSGDGKKQFRQVVSFVPESGIGNGIQFVINYVFFDELSITGDNRSWVQFVRITREYKTDTFPCKNFLKSENGLLTLTPELYSYSDEKYKRIADYGFYVENSLENNLITIEGSQYSDDIDSLESFIISPVTGIEKETTTSITQWDIDTLFDYSDYTKKADGVYQKNGSGALTVSSHNFNSTENVCDRSFASLAQSQILTTGAGKYVSILKFGLPKFPKNLNITNVYIGIKASYYSECAIGYDYGTPDSSKGGFCITLRRFAYTQTIDNILRDKNLAWYQINSLVGVNIGNLPDRYYEYNAPSTNNSDFYVSSQSKTLYTKTGMYDSISGYVLFEIPNCTKEIYNSFVEGGILRHCYPISSAQDSLSITELSIIFKTETSSIKKDIYSPLSGRIYDSAWGRGKTATALIENPKDIIEHCCRLQNWSEVAGHSVIEWGKAYSADALIKTTGDGSFDSTNLDYLTTQSAKVCLQITDKDKQTTTAIKRKMCDSFGLCSYIDKDGYECLETLETTNPSETITLADVIGGIGDVIEPQIENVYCEPVVSWLYNQGSQKFDRTNSITNIGAASWQASYTPGWTLAHGEQLWNICKALYTKYRQIEPCPSEFSDHPELSDYTTVYYYAMRKLSWMDKKRLPTITLAYSKGKDYTIFKHVLVQLPTHTRNSTVECIIEKIVKDKNSGVVKIDCVILGNMETAWYDTSDSTNEKVDTADNANEAVIDV